MRVVHPTPERFDESLALLQAADVAVYGDSDWTEAELREEWEGLDVERDAWLVESQGRLAGVMHLAERRGGRFIGDGYVHPELVGRGVGSLLLRLLEERVRELEPEWPEHEPVVVECAHLVGDARAPALFTSCGYERVRSFFRMVIDVSEPQPAPVWPEGIELRALDVERDGEQVYEAIEEAFAAEWGHRRRPYAEWRKRVYDWRGFEPDLVPVAWDDHEIAGVSLNYPKRMGDWGWVGSIGVQPVWRGRGLGLALLHESFERFRRTGETTVALGVDAENPTGATRLYERAGMRVLYQADLWRKVLRDGD
ncbi:MAG TPA: GNAT family N-acetyltransferase [Gaiella sp.]|nr:GNAT family N-acetyltransferase [Gaiella sp.]